MTHRYPLLTAVLAAALLAGCSSTDSSQDAAVSPDGPFTLTDEQAQMAIQSSIEEGWPDMETTAYEKEDKGISFLVWNRYNRDLVTAQAVKQGENQYSFVIHHDGTAPDEGDDAAKKLSDILGNTAQDMSEK